MVNGDREEVVLPLPSFLAKYRPNNPETVCIDAEIVGVIQHLWACKVETRGSCSGHGKENPSIIVADGYEDADIEWIRQLIGEVDDRTWDIYQWRLVLVRRVGER